MKRKYIITIEDGDGPGEIKTQFQFETPTRMEEVFDHAEQGSNAAIAFMKVFVALQEIINPDTLVWDGEESAEVIN